MGRKERAMKELLRRAAGPERTGRANVELAVLLALMAGMLNAIGFVATNVYTSHMTGIVATIAHDTAFARWSTAELALEALVLFMCGAAFTAVLFNWARRRQLHSKFALVLMAEAVMILTFGALAQQLQGHIRPQLFVAVLCFTMGLQNAVITKMSDATIRTTHVTGMVTDIGIEFGKLLYRNPSGDPDPVRANRAKMRLHLTIVSTFFVGGVLGLGLFRVLEYYALMVPAAALLLAASHPIWADVRGAWRGRHR